MPVVGILVAGKPDPREPLAAFREGLRTLGYIDGQTIRFTMLNAEGHVERLPELAAELVRDKVDVIVAWMTPVVLAAQRATSKIPIVMMGAGDPVGMGIVATLARPGGNITGMAGQTAELAGKHVELLKELLPGLRRIGALCNSADPFSKPFLEQIELAGRAADVEIVLIKVAGGADLDAAFATMADKKIGALIVQPSLPDARVAELAISHRLAAVSPLAPFPRAGGLMSYTASAEDYYGGAAILVDKILRGAKPADLPVEQPTKFELAINLKTAAALGLTVPQSLLARADEIIE
ncbi:MAG TPA: ABC transporter substrate-binding protein [Stellaceae bacterium]|jgi:putative ABC transport system substrate-binding protein|nr:ABC transporter substrate-binding protein [Stellaceae bacterium]